MKHRFNKAEKSVNDKAKQRNGVKKNRSINMSMSLKLVMLMGCFTLFIVLVVFSTQILVSDTLYESIKIREIKASCSFLKNEINSERNDIGEQIDNVSQKNDISVGYYKVINGVIEQQHTSVVLIDSVVYNISQETLKSIYDIAKTNNGIYSGKFGFDFFEPVRSNDLTNNGESAPISVIYASVFGDDGNENMLLLNADVTPITAAKKTFGIQFSYMLMFLLISLILMAYVMSRVISEPLKSINESAKELAKGRYDVEFVGSGYKEIDDLSKTLNYASSELSKNDYLQKELIANISHDLRTPLTMIKGYSEIMKDIPNENTPENVQVIIDETTRLSNLVNDLLDLSKIESGTANLKLERINITEAIKEIIERYSKMNISKNYNIVFENSANDVFVTGDRGMIAQVIYNLVNNAINYCGEDRYVGIKEEIYKDESDRPIVRVSVIDHGIGIESDKLPLIWDRYYKVDSVHKRAVVGTGIGLSIVKRVLEKHGANYGVSSCVGKGSTFWFELEVQ